MPVEVLEPTAEWLTSEDAARYLGISVKTLHSRFSKLLGARSRSVRPGASTRGVGALYPFSALVAVRMIRRAAGCRVSVAVKP